MADGGSALAGGGAAERTRLHRDGSRPRWVWIAVGMAALLLLALYQLWWLLRMRDGYLVSIDEAGYLTIALNDLAGLRDAGLSGLWDAVQNQRPHAPLVPLLAVPALALHKAIMSAFVVEFGALLLTVVAAFGVGRRLTTPRWAAIGAIAVAAMPGMLVYSREFHFSVPCAAALTVAVWAMLSSERMTKWPHVLLWGVSCGLAVLARTMAVGFLPGLLVAALLLIAGAPAPARRRALALTGVAVAAGVGVAALWYWKNFSYVSEYLRGYGYGARAGEYGTSRSPLSLDWWLEEVRLALQQQLFLPLGLVLALVVLACLPLLWRRLRTGTRSQRLQALLRSPFMPLVVFLVTGYLALSSTSNSGSAFALPLLPTLVVTVAALASRLPWRAVRAVAAAGFLFVSLLQLVSFAQIGLGVNRIWVVHPPLLDYVQVLDPRGTPLQTAGTVQNSMHYTAQDAGWLEEARTVAETAAAKANGEGFFPIVAMGMRDRVLNGNMIPLALRIYRDTTIPVAQLDPAIGGDTVAAYRAFLTDPRYGQPNVLITAGDERHDFEPVVTQARAVAAARSLGFRPFATLRQPNGERLTLWWLRRGPAIPAPPSP